MDHRCAPGRIPGLTATGFVTFLVALCLAVSALAVAPARAGILPIGSGDPRVTLPPEGGAFGLQRLGTRSEPQRFLIQNNGLVPITMGDVTLEPSRTYQTGDAVESGRGSFSAVSDCPGAVLLPEASCEVAVTFAPLRPGTSYATLRVTHDGDSGGFTQTLQGDSSLGLYTAGAFGEVLPFGDAKSYGDLSHVAIQTPVLGIATTPSGEGYWLMEARGEMHPFGDAPAVGSPALPPNEYAISLARTPTGKGYWIATQVGGVYALGDAEFFGSATGTLGPDVDIIGIAATPTGKGYWLLDGAGGVHSYGDAAFFGSASSLPPRYPVNAIAATPSGKGYWLIDAAGGVFSYGDAPDFQPDTSYSAYSADYLSQDGVMSAETAPYGQGFAFVRMQGHFGAKGVSLPMSPTYGYSYAYGTGSSGFQKGSFAVDLAFNVSPVRPAPEAGTVVRTGQPGPRAPQMLCAVVACAYPPGPAVPAPPVAGESRLPTGVPVEQVGDGFGDLLAGRDVEELVGAVRVAPRAEDAGDDELGLG